MPNWTSNYIHAEGDPSDIRAFLDAIKADDTVLDFNRIIPMPELLKHTGSGQCTIDSKTVSSWYLIDDKHSRLFTPEEEEQLAEIGYSSWYDWSCAHWGTKWNACRAVIADESDIALGCVRIDFNTAWDAPVPVLKKIVEMFPAIACECRWRHEDED